MTPVEFAAQVRKATKQKASTLSDADIVALANPAKNELAGLLAKRDLKANYFILPRYGTVNNGREINLGPLDPDTVPNSGTLLNHIVSVDVAIEADNMENPVFVRALADTFRRWGVSRRVARPFAPPPEPTLTHRGCGRRSTCQCNPPSALSHPILCPTLVGWPTQARFWLEWGI